MSAPAARYHERVPYTLRKRLSEGADTPESDWVARFADEVIAAADRYRPGKPVVCASGLSPSGPVHLGNLREVLTLNLVADEIRRRGVPCEHIISWDDSDRFRPGARHGRLVLVRARGQAAEPRARAAGQRARELGRSLPRAGCSPALAEARRRVPRHLADEHVHVGRVHRPGAARDA